MHSLPFVKTEHFRYNMSRFHYYTKKQCLLSCDNKHCVKNVYSTMTINEYIGWFPSWTSTSTSGKDISKNCSTSSISSSFTSSPAKMVTNSSSSSINFSTNDLRAFNFDLSATNIVSSFNPIKSFCFTSKPSTFVSLVAYVTRPVFTSLAASVMFSTFVSRSYSSLNSSNACIPCGIVFVGMTLTSFSVNGFAWFAANNMFLLFGKMMLCSLFTASIVRKKSSGLGFIVCLPSMLNVAPMLSNIFFNP